MHAAELVRRGMVSEPWAGRIIGLQMPVLLCGSARAACDAFLVQQVLPHIGMATELNSPLPVLLCMYGSSEVRQRLVEAYPQMQAIQVGRPHAG